MKRPYLILTGLLAFVFFYILVNDVVPGYSTAIHMYLRITKRSESLIDPEALPAERANLITERDTLSRDILASRGKYSQSEIGVIQCVTDNARRNHVLVRSFSPGAKRITGQSSRFDFEISLEAPFSRLCAFIDGLERSAMPFRIEELQINSNPIGEAMLKSTLKATAVLYHGFGPKEH